MTIPLMTILAVSTGIGVAGSPVLAATAKSAQNQRTEQKIIKKASAATLLQSLSKTSNSARYSQANIHQTEQISVAGQTRIIHMLQTLKTERNGKNMMMLGSFTTDVPGNNLQEQLFVDNGKMYMQNGGKTDPKNR